MPGQDNWKEELKKEFSKFSNRPEFFSHEKHVIVTGMAEVIAIRIIEKTLSSQAHALKERMKACVPEEIDSGDPDNFEWEMGHKKCREQTLSAIESIEI